MIAYGVLTHPDPYFLQFVLTDHLLSDSEGTVNGDELLEALNGEGQIFLIPMLEGEHPIGV